MALTERELRDEAAALLRDLIRVDTSNPPGRETAAAALLKEYLEASGVECELVAKDPDRANLVARIAGSGGGPSLGLVGHTDVVPAEESDWRHPPFSGHVDQDGFLWGRGAVDMKNETATRAVTMAILAREGFRPRGDLLFFAEADEENGADEIGMVWLVQARPDLRVDYALNEGGGERLALADGRVVVPLEVGEKSTLPTLVTALGEAGHASTPTAGANAVPRLAVLIQRLAEHRTEQRVLPESRAMLEALGGPLDGNLDGALERATALHPSFREWLPPLFQATIAPTRLVGSPARNVMPSRASVECDCRVVPGTTPGELEAEFRRALGDDLPYELEFLEEPGGGTVSPLGTPLEDACRRFLARRDPEAALLPTLATGFTDSHYLREAWGTVAYGFWPFRHTPNEVYGSGFHNRDERVHVDDLGYAVEFHLEACRAIGSLG
ncbi:MAG TPA: M20/M25/M40 family metallo-hydrolase [Gaiellaceae bacterium]|nr:M20/M25/M40 family metallo-hydrolase [Gaiellaceae bacterium]